MLRSFDPTYRDQLLRYARRAGRVVFLLNIQGFLVAFGIVTIPFSILILRQATNLSQSALYARELAEAEELPTKDKIIAVLITGYDRIGKFLWWYCFWFVFVLCGVFCSRWLLPCPYDEESLLSLFIERLITYFWVVVDKLNSFF